MNKWFYRDVSEADPSSVKFIVAGMPCSGSTFVYQCAKDVLGEGVIKTHGTFRLPVPTLVVVRDFRDVVVCAWRRKDCPKADRSMTPKEIEKWSSDISKAAGRLASYSHNPEAHTVFYEEFTRQPGVLFKYFGVAVGALKVSEIVESHSLNNNRKIASSLAGFDHVDWSSGIHGNHCLNGKVGQWKDFASDLLTTRLRTNLEEYGYPL